MHLTILVPLASVNLSTVATSSIVPWKHKHIPIRSAFRWGSKGLSLVPRPSVRKDTEGLGTRL